MTHSTHDKNDEALNAFRIGTLRDDIKDRQPSYFDGEIDELCDLALKGLAISAERDILPASDFRLLNESQKYGAYAEAMRKLDAACEAYGEAHGRAAEMASEHASATNAHLPPADPAHDALVKDAARYRFRHSQYVDPDGYEYGYCKVRWKNGAVESMLWADDEEIDAAMARSDRGTTP